MLRLPHGTERERRAKPALWSPPERAVLGGSVLCPCSASCTRGARGGGSCPWVPTAGAGSVTAACATPCALGQGPTPLGCARGLKPQPHFALLAKSSFRVKHGVWFFFFFLNFYYVFFPPLLPSCSGHQLPSPRAKLGPPGAGLSPTLGGDLRGKVSTSAAGKFPEWRFLGNAARDGRAAGFCETRARGIPACPQPRVRHLRPIPRSDFFSRFSSGWKIAAAVRRGGGETKGLVFTGWVSVRGSAGVLPVLLGR